MVDKFREELRDLKDLVLAQGAFAYGMLSDAIAALQELDTTDVPITSHAIPMRNVYREDEVRPSLPVEEVVANAPDGLEEYFRVPRIVEE